jgi:hypothetical protein
MNGIFALITTRMAAVRATTMTSTLAERVLGETGEKLISPFGEAPLYAEISVLHVPRLAHTAQKCAVGSGFKIRRTFTTGKKTNAPKPG